MKKSKSKKGVAKRAATAKPKAAVTPLGDRVLVKRAAPEEVTPFGMIIPDTAKEKSEQGSVIAVGPGRKADDGRVVPVSVKPGDKVLFSYGEEIKVGGVEYVLVREDNILAVLNK